MRTPQSHSVVSVLELRAQSQPEMAAFSFFDGEQSEAYATLSYASLQQRARTLAGELSARGLSEQVVLLSFPEGPDFIVAFFAALYARCIAAACTPLSPRHAQARSLRFQQIARDSGARTVLTTRAYAAATRQLAGEHTLEFLYVDACEDSAAGRCAPVPPFEADRIAYLQYTSGSTGGPRGVMISHGNLAAYCATQATLYDPGSVHLSVMPLSSNIGLINGVIAPLCLGLRALHALPQAMFNTPQRWLQLISQHGVTASGGPNSLYVRTLFSYRPELYEGLQLERWERAYNAGELVHRATLERFFEVFRRYGLRKEALTPVIGMSEGTLRFTSKPKHEPARAVGFERAALLHGHARPASDGGAEVTFVVSCGAPLPSWRLLIVDPQTHATLPEAAVGEVWVAGEGVARGYWQRPQETAEVFHARLADGSGPFLRTGDLGFLLRGELFITGRLKELIRVVLGRTSPDEIEHSVEASAAVFHNATIAAFASFRHSGADLAEQLVVVAEVDDSAAADALREAALAAGRAVAREHQTTVSAVVLVTAGAVPRTPTGKTHRLACRERFERGELPIVLQVGWREIRSAALPAREPTPERGP